MNSNTDTGAVTFGELVLAIAEAKALVVDLEINERPNQHGTMNVTVLADEVLKDYIMYEGQGIASLVYYQDGNLKTLFQGIIMHLATEAVSDTYFVHITVQTSSCMMDFAAYNLSLQDTAMTSHQLISQVLRIFPGSQALIWIPELSVDGITVIYQETVWAFLERFVSRYEALLFVDSTSQRIQIKVGLTDTEEPADWNGLPYQVKRNLSPSGLDCSPKEVTYYQVDIYEILPMGTKVQFHNQDMYIGGVSRFFQNGLLVNRYYLYFKEGLRIKQYFNPLITGVSIDGVVTGVQRDRVSVRMATDVLKEYQNQYFFPFSTVAASADGSGWYCMPQSGDPVRIFFPVSDEREGYAISNILGQSSPGSGDPMENPDLKDITTPDGKTVQFLENGILMSVGENGSITLTNDGKVEIKTEEDIVIGAAGEIEVKTEGELKITAELEIQINSEAGSSIMLTKEEITAAGNRIHNN